MNALPRRILRQLVADYGPALLNDPARVDALLADLCGQYHCERFLLVHALRERNSATNWPIMYWLESCSQRLQSQYCFSAEAAQWAMESWSAALDIAPPNPNTLRDDEDIRNGSHAELAESPQGTLCQLLTDYGPALVNDPARADALLADLCGQYPRERFLLVHALRARVPADLLSQPQGGPAHGQRLTQRLRKRYGFSAEATQWAIESWSLALNVEKLPVPRSQTATERSGLTDRDVLVTFYHATNGANWSNSENWLSNAPLDTWHGVTTDSSSRVNSLFLGANELSGPIPAELGNLSNLISLYLTFNQLSGTIPPQLGNLSNLTYLSLAHNKLSGSIPPQLGNLSNLTDLSLAHNKLSGSIPPQLGNLSNLTDLSLTNNQLSGPVPIELRVLSNLKKLALDEKNKAPGPGRFRQIAPDRANQSTPTERSVPNDRDVLVAFYHATNGPKWWNNKNWLSSVPLGSWYGVTTDNSGRVTRLFLEHNKLSGSISPQLGNLSNLESLDLSNNRLRGSVPPELSNLSNLTGLSLRNNQLSGTIPPQLGNLPNLTDLYLAHNQLSGSIPPELSNLSNLTDLYLRNNQLSGAIPPQLASLSNLERLDLSKNQLSGAIPSELAKFSNTSTPKGCLSIALLGLCLLALLGQIVQ